MTVKNYFKFKGVTFLLSGSIKFLDGDYACEHTKFGGLCIKCVELLRKNKTELLTNGADKSSIVDEATKGSNKQ